MAQRAACKPAHLIGEQLPPALRIRRETTAFPVPPQRISAAVSPRLDPSTYATTASKSARSAWCQTRHPGAANPDANGLRNIGVIESARSQAWCASGHPFLSVTIAGGATLIEHVESTRLSDRFWANASMGGASTSQSQFHCALPAVRTPSVSIRAERLRLRPKRTPWLGPRWTPNRSASRYTGVP